MQAMDLTISDNYIKKPEVLQISFLQNSRLCGETGIRTPDTL